MSIVKYAPILSVVLLISGCASVSQPSEHHEEVTKQYQDSKSLLPESAHGIFTADEIYLGSGQLVEVEPDILKRVIKAPGMKALKPQTVVDFAKSLSETTNIQVKVASDIFSPRESEDDNAIAINDSSNNAATFGLVPSNGKTLMAKDDEKQLPKTHYNIPAGTTVKQALNEVVSQYGFGWEVTDNGDAINIFRYQTESFDIPLPNSNKYAAMNVGDAPAESQAEVQYDSINRLLEMAKELTTEEGIAFATDGSSIIVSDKPSQMVQIKKVIDKEIKKMGRQILLQVKMFTVEQSQVDSFTMNWDLVYSNGDQASGLTTNTSMVGAIDGVSAGIQIINPMDNFNGSNVELDALSKQEGLSVAYENDFLTLSGRPIVSNETRTQAYLKSITQSSGGGVDDYLRTSLEPGEIVTGLSMMIHPLISDGDIILDLLLNHNSLVNLSSEESGDSRITTPETTGRNVSQTVRLNNGGMVALSGFLTTSASGLDQGVGVPQFKLLGGESSADEEQRKAIIVISATVME